MLISSCSFNFYQLMSFLFIYYYLMKLLSVFISYKINNSLLYSVSIYVFSSNYNIWLCNDITFRVLFHDISSIIISHRLVKIEETILHKIVEKDKPELFEIILQCENLDINCVRIFLFKLNEVYNISNSSNFIFRLFDMILI